MDNTTEAMAKKLAEQEYRIRQLENSLREKVQTLGKHISRNCDLADSNADSIENIDARLQRLERQVRLQ